MLLKWKFYILTLYNYHFFQKNIFLLSPRPRRLPKLLLVCYLHLLLRPPIILLLFNLPDDSSRQGPHRAVYNKLTFSQWQTFSQLFWHLQKIIFIISWGAGECFIFIGIMIFWTSHPYSVIRQTLLNLDK